MNPMPLKQLLADYVDTTKITDINILGLAIDHRQVKKGDVFFACRGLSVHGKVFIDKAIAAGAIAVVLDTDSTEEREELSRQHSQFPLFAISDLTEKLGFIAAKFYGQPSALYSLVGITGTNGKTSCAHLLAQCLDNKERPCGVIGTLGAGMWGALETIQRTTPDAFEVQYCLHMMAQQHAAYVAMEVSSHGLVQGRVNGCFFDIAVFTNLTRDHLDYHGDMMSYGNAKLMLFKRPELKKVVVNLDDPYACTIIDTLDKAVEVVGITLQAGLKFEGVQIISASNIRLESQGLSFDVASPWGHARLQSQLLGDFNVSNLLTVLAVSLLLDFSFSSMIKKLNTASAPAGRLETFGNHKTPLVVVDYAHTPDALEKVLLTLQAHAKGKLHVLFGCGGDRDKGKRPEMGALAEKMADVVWLTDDNPRTEASVEIINDVLRGVKKPQAVFVESDRKVAIEAVISGATSVEDIVLIAGKGHEEYQIIKNQKIPFSDRQIVTKILGEAA